MPTEKNNSRIDIIDTAKGIGIILVILSHLLHIKNSLIFIYSFHMPLFFFISGMFFMPDKYKGIKPLIKHKFKTMVLPYLFFCFLGLLYQVMNFIIYKRDGFVKYFIKAVFSVFYPRDSHNWITYINGPLWFVPSLLFIQITFYLLYKVLKNKISFYIITVLVLPIIGWFTVSRFTPIDTVWFPFNFSSSLFAMSFFALGNIVIKYFYKEISEFKSNKKSALLIPFIGAVSFVVTCFTAFANGKVSIGSRVLHNGFLFFISGVSGTVFVFCLSAFLKKSRLLNYCGRNTFVIMGTHIIFNNILNDVIGFLDNRLSTDIAGIISTNRLVSGIIHTIISGAFALLFAVGYNFALSRIKTKKHIKIQNFTERDNYEKNLQKRQAYEHPVQKADD